MLRGVWGTKIGMTQVFESDSTVAPVTVVDVSGWYVTQIKSIERDGYRAIQVAKIKKRYADREFESAWLANPHTYFVCKKEIELTQDVDLTVGARITVDALIAAGMAVDVVGTTIGRGFQGAVKRHGFTGGRGSHGDKLGRKPGSMSFMRSRGRVIKGKKLPGHMGVERCKVKNLKVVHVEAQADIVLLKGSLPGKTGSLVYLSKRG